MKTIAIAAALLSLALAAGCSASESKDPVPGTGTPGGSTTAPAPSDTAPVDGTPPDTTPKTPAVVLKAPQIDMVAKMQGGLHVMWTNNESACDELDLERKTATVAYAVVATVPGEADNKHDATATMPTMYTYRVRCKKQAVYSAYSNEMSGKP